VTKKRTIDARLRDLEERLIEPPKPICKVCGTEGGGPVIFEQHREDGVVEYEPRMPCPGCDALRPPGEVRRIIICPHGCWCGKEDREKVEAARKVVRERPWPWREQREEHHD
jgi:hypothetical protein